MKSDITKQAGKGDNPRPVNFEKFSKNYDQIVWKTKKQKQFFKSSVAQLDRATDF